MSRTAWWVLSAAVVVLAAVAVLDAAQSPTFSHVLRAISLSVLALVTLVRARRFMDDVRPAKISPPEQPG